MSKPDRSPMALVTIEARSGRPTLEDAAMQLGVEIDALDKVFGVIPLDVNGSLFSVQVRADALPSDFDARTPFRGPFADPEIQSN